MRLSARIPRDLSPTPLYRAYESAAGAIDLTLSNPTRAGIAYPLREIGDALAATESAVYEPSPCGLSRAREAVSRASGGRVHPERIILTASTSEAYALLFKALCDPGDTVSVPAPSYPLCGQLAALEGVRPRTYRLQYQGRWSLDHASLEATLETRTRAVVSVNPNNPTGSNLAADDAQYVAELCRHRGAVVIADEVFRPYGYTDRALGSLAPTTADAPLTVVLDGLSKRVGLPQLKLAWMELYGADAEVNALRAALEWAADAFLSVATPVQLALPTLLELGPGIQEQIRARLSTNREILIQSLEPYPEIQVLAADGGWYAVLRIPEVESDERWAWRLCAEHQVIVHPGFFYDFAHEGYLVSGLIAEPKVFACGCERLARGVAAILGAC